MNQRASPSGGAFFVQARPLKTLELHAGKLAIFAYKADLVSSEIMGLLTTEGKNT
jgi:hypothetical protein